MENKHSLAPIVVFGFVRANTLSEVFEGLKKNRLAADSDLFVFVDGPRKEENRKDIREVVKLCHSISGFKSVTIKESERNMGLDPSVIAGVTEVINRYGKAVVLEDDVVPGDNFLDFMNQCLDTYETDNRIMSISGWAIDIKIPQDYPYDVYMFGRSSSWGWATWKDRWDSIDWDVTDWNDFKHDLRAIRWFNGYGGSDQFGMLKKCMEGGNMWDARFNYSLFRQGKYSIIPLVSKTYNIGFDNQATHCKPVKYKRYTTTLDLSGKSRFNISTRIEPNKEIIRQRLWVSSWYVRITTKLKNMFL